MPRISLQKALKRSPAQYNQLSCVVCHGHFYSGRKHARTCSDRCRKILSRITSDKN